MSLRPIYRALTRRFTPGESWHDSYLVLLVVFLISLFIRLWLLDKRWINVDEGAHLMDGVLTLDGKIPQVDFASRSPIYVYTIAGILKLFGTNYISGRLLSVTCSLLVGIVVFLLAKALFDRKVALLSSAMYWMLPLELMQSAVVKTEPLGVLLACLAVYSVVRFSVRAQKLWLIVAGILAGFGFYVRPSALIIPFVVFAFIVLFHRGQVHEVVKNLGFFLAGYTAVVLFVLGYYSRFVSPGELFTSDLNPFGLLALAVGRLLSLRGLSLGSRDIFLSQASTVSWDHYYEYIGQGFYLHSFLLIGLGFSVVELGYRLLTQSTQERRQYVVSHAILYLWILFLFLGYAFQFYTRGFFIDYSREFLPPLVIIFCAWFRYTVPALEREGVLDRIILGGVGVSGLVFFMQANYRDFFGVGHHASLVIALTALFGFAKSFESSTRRFVFMSLLLGIVALIAVSRQAPLKAHLSGALPSVVMIGTIYGLTWALLGENARPPLRDYGKFVCRSLVLASFVVSMSFSATLLDMRYDSTWSPQSLGKIASTLSAHTNDADEVMSGGVIWELQALRRPFHTISHPLAFEYGMSERTKKAIELAVATRPPKAIILDGYTEKIYIRQVPRLMELFTAKYQFVTAAGPAVFPVRLYLHDNNASWPFKTPAELGLDGSKLDQFAANVGGVGCIVKDGYMVKSWGDEIYKKASWTGLPDWGSAVKPVMSTMLFFAVHEGKLSSVDALIKDWGWELIEKDQPMTFRHLANMVSGYARVEAPGKVWGYNDFGISLYKKTLFDRVFKQSLDDVVETRLASLQFQDGRPFFDSPTEVVTARDFARIGWLWLNKGNWKGQQLLPRQFFDNYLKPQVRRDLGRTSAATTDYLGVKSVGGSTNLALSDSTEYGPGVYGFNWWFNTKVGTSDNLVWPDAPPDIFMANGYFTRSIVTVIPSLGLVVAARGNWGEFKPGDRTSGMNQNLKLLVDAVTTSRRR